MKKHKIIQRKFTCLMLVLSLFFVITGCGDKTQTDQTSREVYTIDFDDMTSDDGGHSATEATTEKPTTEATTEKPTTESTTEKTTTEATTEESTTETTTEDAASSVQDTVDISGKKPKKEYNIYNGSGLYRSGVFNASWYGGSVDWGFSEGRAWVTLEKEERNTDTLALIDKNGTIVLEISAEEYKNYVLEDERKYYGVKVLGVKYGYAVMYNDAYNNGKDNGEFIIIDKNGKITYRSKDNDPKTVYFFLGRCEKGFLVIKRESSFSESQDKLLMIDNKGTIIQEIDTSGIEVSVSNTWEDLGSGVIANDNQVLITDKWQLFTKLRADVNGYYVIDDYLFSMNGHIKISDIDGDDSEIIKNNNNVTPWGYGDGLWLSDKKYYDIDGNLVITPDIPDTVKIMSITPFNNGHAFILMKGADEDAYIVSIDKNGSFESEPYDIGKYDKVTLGENVNGYVPVFYDEYGNNNLICIARCDGSVIPVGNDMSELKGLDFEGLLYDGFFYSGRLELPLTFNGNKIEDSNAPFFISLDGKTVINKAYEY